MSNSKVMELKELMDDIFLHDDNHALLRVMCRSDEEFNKALECVNRVREKVRIIKENRSESRDTRFLKDYYVDIEFVKDIIEKDLTEHSSFFGAES